MTLDYFYGQAGKLFSFYRIPKALFQEQRFQNLSTDAKTLYGILLDRMSLSVKNEWFDKQGRVFIIFTIEDVKRALCCADNKATKLLRELENFGLIERKRRGLGKPSLVYVKNFSSDLSNERVQNRENHESGSPKNACQDPPKSRCNKNKKSKTERNNTNPILSDELEKMKNRKLLEEYFSRSLEIELLLRLYPDDEDTIYQIVDLLVDTCDSKRNLIRIAGDDKPAEVVLSRLKKLNADHIRFVLDCLAANTSPIRNILFSGGTQVSGQTMYSAEDRDIRGAEQDYKKLEKELDKKIKRTPTDHPGYNEYQYHLDPIEHDPWQLTSYLTTLYDDYTRSEVQGKLKETFKKQYKLTTWVEVQIRYKTVWVISPAGIPVPTQVPYEYRIFHTKLVNKGLEVVIREELNNDQWKRYEIFQDTLGGRPYLFNGGLPPGGSDGSGTPGIDYQVPAEALTDEEFAAIYEEAKKYVGTPYVWGGSTPETGFDCSGYVCWVYNQNGYNVGRTTANGLWNKSQHISEAEAKPGDLVFFKGTYDTPGMSHVGIYLGNGKMVSAGDPIKYADIHSPYWQQYLAGFGRLSK